MCSDLFFCKTNSLSLAHAAILTIAVSSMERVLYYASHTEI